MSTPADTRTERDEPRPGLMVMLSGRGSTLENLIERCDAGALHARVVLVVASRECRGAEIAREAGIDTRVIGRALEPDELTTLVRTHGVDLVVLAGYLRLVPVPAELDRRIVNIHPALLPAFGGSGMHGAHVHEAVAAAAARGEVTESGCTVHFCDATYDTGEIVLQKRCPVSPSDTPEQIAARVGGLEREAYPEAIRMVLERARTGRAS